MRTSRKTISAVVALCCAMLGLAAVIAVADEEAPPGDGVAQITAIESEAEEAMAVLEESRTTTDALPATPAERLDEEGDFGMNPDLSRLAIGNLANSVFLIPAADHVCAGLTVGDGLSISCPETEQVADGEAGPTTVALDGEDIAIYGVVPDGVDEVTVETGVSASDVVETEGNAYYTVLESGTVLRKVSYEGPSGEVEFPIFDPSVVGAEE
jgi:hypothetical protein